MKTKYELSLMTWSDLRNMAMNMGHNSPDGLYKDELVNWIYDIQSNNQSSVMSQHNYEIKKNTQSSSIIKKLNTHNFTSAIQNIQSFAQNLPGYVQFDKYEVDGGPFGWGNHNITGEEMNSFVSKLQGKLNAQNNSISKIVSEFTQIYKAFDSLDKDYIQGILTSVHCAEEASNQALSASTKALENDADIKRIIENLEKTTDKANDASQRALNNETENKRIIENLKKTIQILLEDEKKYNQKITDLETEIKIIHNSIDKANGNDLFDGYSKLKKNTDFKLLIAYTVSGISLILVLLKTFGII